jgi:single-stranded DNA-binding protein
LPFSPVFPPFDVLPLRVRPDLAHPTGLNASHRKNCGGAEHKNTDWFQIQVWGPLAKFGATPKAGTAVIVEGKIKPETYTADGVEHKTFSIKADYVRKIDYSAPSEASESTAAKPTKKTK